MEKHSPGPWKYVADATGGWIFSKKVNAENRIARVEKNILPNTCLIAQAPALLKAAKDYVKLQKLIEKWKAAEQSDSYEIMDEIVAFGETIKVKEAIAKAEGKC